MTRQKTTTNRKPQNKTSAYLTDSLRDFLKQEASRPGQTRSSVIQEALALLKKKRDAQRN